MTPTPSNRVDATGVSVTNPAAVCQAAFAQAFADGGAADWGLAPETFAAALEPSIRKQFGSYEPSASQIRDYILSLHLQDLALASACAQGHTQAWEFFITEYRSYLRSAAAALLRCQADSPSACDLADSLFADLYGLSETARSRSLFRYFHGRSSLKTWLRAVLAQRHIDAIRSARRFRSLDETGEPDDGEALNSPAIPQVLPIIPDPDRGHYLELFRCALEAAFSLLDPRDKERLRLYYSEEQTLAEIGSRLGEHESTVSRKLDSIRRELRLQVEQALRNGVVTSNAARQAGMSEAQVVLCFEYASEDAPIDFGNIFPATAVPAWKPKGGGP